MLGLIFLKYISDAFEERHQQLLAEVGEGADPEDPDEYRAVNVFWVPPEARWQTLQDNAKQPTIGKLIDEAMFAIERDNPQLKGILPKDSGRPALDKHRLGELIDVIARSGWVMPRTARRISWGIGKQRLLTPLIVISYKIIQTWIHHALTLRSDHHR